MFDQYTSESTYDFQTESLFYSEHGIVQVNTFIYKFRRFKTNQPSRLRTNRIRPVTSGLTGNRE